MKGKSHRNHEDTLIQEHRQGDSPWGRKAIAPLGIYVLYSKRWLEDFPLRDMASEIEAQKRSLREGDASGRTAEL